MNEFRHDPLRPVAGGERPFARITAPRPDFEKCGNCGRDAEEFCLWDPADGWCCRGCGGCDSRRNGRTCRTCGGSPRDFSLPPGSVCRKRPGMSGGVTERTCGHKFVLTASCAICAAWSADKRLSELHDALYDYDGQPSSRTGFEQERWERARDRMNGLVWKMHDLLRGVSGGSP